MEKYFLHNTRHAFALCIFYLSCLVACEKKSISFGENLAESYTNIIVIDTLTPVISTIRIDSFPTSNTATVQLGSYDDAVFGNISASSYFQLSIPGITEIPKDAIFDSLTLQLMLTKEYYGDTNIVQQINVHELTSKISYYGENTSFYNTSTIPYTNVSLGTKQYSPKPNKADTLEIRLSDLMGQDFLNKLKDKATELTDQVSFLKYFKGLVITTGSSSSSIFGYSATDSTLRMRLYYTEKGITFTKKFIDFNLANPELQFNQITIDRSNTVLSALPKNADVPSSQLGHSSYLQSATGIFTKIRFPSLPDLLQIKKTGKILKAILIIKPLAGSFNGTTRLPAELNLVTTNKNNSYGTALTENSATGATLNGDLTIDNLYGENTSYTYDITTYLQQQINENPNLGYGLLLYPPQASAMNSFNRLIIGDNTTSKSKIQVKIFYLAVD